MKVLTEYAIKIGDTVHHYSCVNDALMAWENIAEDGTFEAVFIKFPAFHSNKLSRLLVYRYPKLYDEYNDKVFRLEPVVLAKVETKG